MSSSDASFSFPVDAVLLVGPTGVGKSPLGDHLATHGLFGRKAHHLDFGSELRSLVSLSDSLRPNYSSEELTFIHDVLHGGLLLENEHFPLARKIIDHFLLRQKFRSSHLLILNGIPRHVGQAQDITTIARVHALIHLVCSVNDVYTRLETNVGGDRSKRTDDNRDLVVKKLLIFEERTAPLLSHYRTQGAKIYDLPVTSTSSASQKYALLSSLTAADPPVTLIAEPPQR
ncbi:MAG: nucleoside monophosphate kinase [Nitrospiraceae bacterium]|nr:nucleoside monophosphate kinase [Nitrospiraceae bacterium]